MRGYLPDYEMRVPRGLPDALALLADGWRPFAGGTDLMVLLEAGQLPPARYLTLWGLKELRGIRVGKTEISLGALTTYAQIREHEHLRRELPMLCEAARLSGATAIQNRGTLGGNIANASPAADSPPALLAYDAELELVSVLGRRRVSYDGFHSGYKKTILRPGELIAAIHFPRPQKGNFQHYRKVGTRRAQAISKVSFAGRVLVKAGTIEEARVAMGSVAPIVLRCRAVEQALKGGKLEASLIAPALQALERDIAPIDDIRSTAHFRRKVAANLLEEFIDLAGEGPARSGKRRK